MTPSANPLSAGEITAIVVATFTMLSSLFSLAFLLGRYSVRLSSVERILDKMQIKADETKCLILEKIEELPCHSLATKKGC
jgi:hypothetical protein